LKDLVKAGLPKNLISSPTSALKEDQLKNAFQVIQKTELQAPSTRSVLTVGEESLAKSILRLGDVDFFSVVARKPRICDNKPVVVEVALARFLNRGGGDEQVQLLRFANRVPLQFDKGACAITQAVETVNWRAYGLQQSKNSLPMGSYVFAISVVSPFIKFKNASKETIDSSDELVEEIRRALMQAGQKLSRHIRREGKEADLERKIAHIEQFGPILIEYLGKIVNAKESRRKKAEEGLKKLLGRDASAAEKELSEAELRLAALKEKQAKAGLLFSASAGAIDGDVEEDLSGDEVAELVEITVGDNDETTSTKRTRMNKGTVLAVGDRGSAMSTEKSAGTQKDAGTQKSAGTQKEAGTQKAAAGTQKSTGKSSK
jgi:DNA topoisomerase-6 subunit B